MIAGSLAFVAPEQIETAAVDPRSDLYAFGAMLYYVLTGRTLIDTTRSSSNSEPLEHKRDSTPRAIPDGPLADILAALLPPHLEHRYQTANELTWPATQRPASQWWRRRQRGT